MKIRPTAHPDVLFIEPDVFEDPRGAFLEVWREERYTAAGVGGPFVQDNVSRSSHGTLRGLHFQDPHPQGKLLHVLDGTLFDVAVDIRRGSARFGQWVGLELKAHEQVWVPPGFAHGFCVTSPMATVLYKCTAPYSPASEHVLRWDDPALGIRWPIATPKLSERDLKGRLLSELP